MARYSGAVQRLIHPGNNDPSIIVIGAILHVDAMNAKSLFNFFNGPSNGIESHFHIPVAGKPEQYRDTGYEADANFKANSFYKNGKRYGYVSIETQGFGSGKWNAHQLEEIKDLLLWLSRTHKFPLRVCRTPTDPGVGFHTLFGAPGPWTPVAKECPGKDRIKQFYSEIVPWMSNPYRRPKENEVELSDKVKFGKAVSRELGMTSQTVNGALQYASAAYVVSQRNERQLNALAKAMEAMAEGLNPTIRTAVKDALKDAVIDVNVTVNADEQ